MWLAVDSGNTRVKWALMQERRIVMQQAAAKARLRLPHEKVSGVWVAHTGSAADLRRLQSVLSGKGRVHYIKSRRLFAGMQNPYQPAAALGVDRWLCLLAARQLPFSCREGAVIVSAGTAITIDVLSSAGEFLGGLILPGLRLLPAALSLATPLPHYGWQEVKDQPAKDTAAAIALGALLAAAGAVQLARRRYAAGARVLLTGGDAACLLPYLPAAKLMPNLLFSGMAVVKAGAK